MNFFFSFFPTRQRTDRQNDSAGEHMKKKHIKDQIIDAIEAGQVEFTPRFSSLAQCVNRPLSSAYDAWQTVLRENNVRIIVFFERKRTITETVQQEQRVRGSKCRPSTLTRLRTGPSYDYGTEGAT